MEKVHRACVSFLIGVEFRSKFSLGSFVVAQAVYEQHLDNTIAYLAAPVEAKANILRRVLHFPRGEHT